MKAVRLHSPWCPQSWHRTRPYVPPNPISTPPDPSRALVIVPALQTSADPKQRQNSNGIDIQHTSPRTSHIQHHHQQQQQQHQQHHQHQQQQQQANGIGDDDGDRDINERTNHEQQNKQQQQYHHPRQLQQQQVTVRILDDEDDDDNGNSIDVEKLQVAEAAFERSPKKKNKPRAEPIPSNLAEQLEKMTKGRMRERRVTALSDGNIETAVIAWGSDAAAAESEYGHISGWD